MSKPESPRTMPDKHTKAVTLKSGGTITLAIEGLNVTLMTPEERRFVFGLIDAMNDYQAGRVLADAKP